MTRRALTRDDLRRWIRFGSSSPLYMRLVEVIGADPALLGVLNEVEHTPRPNVLLAAVQYLLMRTPTEPLASHYPNIGGPGNPDGRLEDRFRDFVLSHREQLLEIGRTRYTQTNECRRCAVLLPVIWLTPARSFHLVDVGTSAGLNLQLDRYHYRWGGLEWGPPSTVQLEADSRGADLSPRRVEVLSRTGLDLHPVQAADPDDRLWLEALIWPEHTERRQRLSAALTLAARYPVTMVAGDAVTTVGQVIDALPDGEPAIVMHSFALNQFSSEARGTFQEALQGGRAKHPIFEISFDAMGRDDGAGALGVDDGSGYLEVGTAHPHGEWLSLYARP